MFSRRKLPALAACLLGLCLPRPAFALDGSRAVTQHAHEAWMREEGLPSRTVLSLAQSAEGYLWVGTPEGLARFDGSRFSRFTARSEPRLPSREARRLLAGPGGALWIGTEGLFRFAAGEFETVVESEALPGTLVQTLLPGRSGAVVVVTDTAVVEVAGGRSTPLLTPDEARGARLTAALLDEAGRLWFGTESHGLGRKDASGVVFLTRRDGLAADAVGPLARDRNGTLWVGTPRGLCAIEAGRIRRLGVEDGLPSDLVTALLPDRDGNLWIGTNRGLGRLSGGRLSSLSSRDGLSGDAVNCLLEDRDGSLWVGTEQGGLTRLRDAPFVVFGVPEGLAAEVVWTVHEDPDGAIWVGGYGGRVARLLGGRVESLELPGDRVNDRVSTLARDGSGTLWAGTLTGLVALRAGRFVRQGPRGVPPGTVKCLLADRRGRLWVGTTHGLGCLGDGCPRPLGTGDGLPGEVVRAFHEDAAGRIWAGTDGGLGRLEGERFVAFNPEEGPLPVWAIHEAEGGVLWLGTPGKGLARFDGASFRRITAADGLFDDVVYTVLGDGAGRLWMSSNNGVFRLGLAEAEAFLAGTAPSVRCASHGTADGLRDPECNGGVQPAGLRGRDGRLWFATASGVAVVDPLRVGDGRPAPPVAVESVQADGREVAGPGLPAGTGRLEVRYTALLPADPAAVRFRHRLEGFDEGWVEAGARRTAAYTRLPPGDYRFVVQASYEDGGVSSREASVRLRLPPLFHQTAGFRAAMAGAAAGVGFLLYAARVRSVRRRYDEVLSERTRVARELHDTLAQGLAAAVVRIGNAREALPPGAEASERHLLKAEEAARQGLDEARRAVWGLRSPALAQAALAQALAAFARERAEGSGVEVVVEGAGRERRLPPDVEAELLRIGQEAVVNAVAHARPGRIRVGVAYTKSEVSVVVEDDGGGFDPNAPAHERGRYGLLGLRERAERLGGRLTVRSAPGGGTLVAVTVPS